MPSGLSLMNSSLHDPGLSPARALLDDSPPYARAGSSGGGKARELLGETADPTA